ncbi:DUF2516 family protein [Streptomyces sp. JJ36]|uniref:DUF2516 family protein n=1 Tax=Streptomyces sp. JJ36 TaxID=2736645 RepID=UPI001F2E9ED4|nr:DUF2516 family protein [Streptomyces sp. JJ36]MCF6524191.1 DUF2516 family protein [Streptomyces sp. JJ36]
MLMQGFGTLLWLISLVVLGMAVFALIDAALRREDAYRATGKQTKPFWLIILGVTVAVNIFLGMIILQIIGLIATIVYIVDVRPALKGVMGGGPRRGGSSSDGPYGPYNGR